MKKIYLLIFTFTFFFSKNIAISNELQNHKNNIKSNAGYILETYIPHFKGADPKSMANAANTFLNSLTNKQRTIINHSLESTERQKWSNIPVRGQNGGIALANLNKHQLKLFLNLLRSLISEYGYNKIRDVMLGDDLRSIIDGKKNLGVGIEDFRLVIFGTPSITNQWAVQLDGHHIALNISIFGNNYSFSPSFIGTFPENYKINNSIRQPLAGEVDIAFNFMDSLTKQQKEKAIISSSPIKLKVGPGKDHFVPKPKGLNCSSLNDYQAVILFSLANQWLDIMPTLHSKKAKTRFLRELNHTWFSWGGLSQKGSEVSYKIQGPTFMIEFKHDRRGGAEKKHATNHIHTMFRNFQNDYGKKN